MPLNLAGIQRFIEGEMVDEIIITRDLAGTEDDIFDPVTGQYIQPGGDDEVWYHGRGLIMALSVFPRTADEVGGVSLSVDFELHIPVTSEVLTNYDRITVVECDRTPHLVGVDFRVRSLMANTFSVSQAARVYRWDQRLNI